MRRLDSTVTHWSWMAENGSGREVSPFIHAILREANPLTLDNFLRPWFARFSRSEASPGAFFGTFHEGHRCAHP
jgi:hypothetical protein